MQRRSALRYLLSSFAAIGVLPTARAQTRKITLGYTAVTDFASVFAAAEEGYFKKNGLEVELKFIPLNSTIPAAVESDSIQIGGPTPTVFLQSVDGGLDHVVLSGGGVLSKSFTDLGLTARAGSGIRSAQDCVGKKIGVPGIGALLHVAFRQWLKNSGVDPKKVTFIEAAFPQHMDLLNGGSLDAVVTGGPFMRRIVDGGTGYVAAYFTTFLPEGQTTILQVAKREWAERNPDIVKDFRKALAEGAAWVGNPANDAKLRQHIGKYIKLPPAALATMQISPQGPVVQESQIRWWLNLMKEQDMLKSNINTTRLIFKAA
jgi:NitT/TauT family transport system substrate-binding protein